MRFVSETGGVCHCKGSGPSWFKFVIVRVVDQVGSLNKTMFSNTLFSTMLQFY